jgi:hypothetical protein
VLLSGEYPFYSEDDDTLAAMVCAAEVLTAVYCKRPNELGLA